jgi:hypothetical protein
MANYVRATIKLNPREDMTDEAGGSHVILASEIAKMMSVVFDTPVGAYDSAAAVQGAADGAPNYLAADETTPLAISTEATALFIMLRHTGYEYDDATTLGATAATDYLKITMGASDEVVAIIPPGGVWFTSSVAGIDCANVKISRVDETGAAADDAFDFAVEFWAFD